MNENNNENNGYEHASTYGGYSWNYVEPQNQLIPSPPPKARKKKHGLGALILSLCLICTILAGSAGGIAGYLIFQGPGETYESVGDTGDPASSPGNEQSSSGAQQDQNAPFSPVAITDTSTPLSIQEIFAKGDPSTVAISTQTTTNVFGQQVSQAAAGSGFILSENGYIMTNYHVIDGATDITVMINDGTEYKAVLVGGDEISDIAVLKIEASGLKAVEIADSDKVVVGDQVVAIGNPLGELANSLTVGYISAKEREISIDQYPRTMLQTDASVSPGNSGGPLFNIYGQVIGVVSAKTVADGVEGIGFAIPINTAIEVAEELIENGYVTGRPYIGIGYEEITSQVARYYNLPVGLYVTSVQSGSAAEKAGLVQGDVITKLDDYTISSAADMYSAKLKYKAGDTVTLTISRGGTTMTLKLTFDEQKPASSTQQQTSPNQFPGFTRPGQSSGQAG